MPHTPITPKAGRSPLWHVRETEFGFYLDRSAQTGDRREAAPVMLSLLARQDSHEVQANLICSALEVGRQVH